ncbi:nucleotidyltransferase [Methylococcaceae bacterium CS1]|nr:nucleotidyltransferase [Methylococcaceae bacterium CS5]TXL02376.1 nucleotidyltransferase [Methylococcaceae bacterium CS1]TXL03367.1 nucleotidyltransferase [Methylococcaceae bacterium CS2]
MSTHIYAFGSVCRGEVDPSSDIDLLACLSKPQQKYDTEKFSIYSHERIQELWLEGNPFSWHLHLESKLIYSTDGSNFLSDLGKPAKYLKYLEDCNKFNQLFLESYHTLLQSRVSSIFHLSCMFLATRNFAMCYSLGAGNPIFSRLSPLELEQKLAISQEDFDLYARARILSTRGYGSVISRTEIEKALGVAPAIIDWMNELIPQRVVA